jgi:Ca2+-binding RTX toxin-like protein
MTKFTGTSGDDNFVGTGEADVFDLRIRGGEDTAIGNGGDDVFVFDGGFDSGDRIDGGEGFDTVVLAGNYFLNVAFDPNTIQNVEKLLLTGAFYYNLTFDDGTIASGASMLVDARASGNLTLDASAEIDGHLNVIGGAGDDVITLGGSGTSIKGNAGDDMITILDGSAVARVITGGDGDDTIVMAHLQATDQIDGGNGLDTLVLDGDYSAGITLSSVAFEVMGFGAGFDYAITAAPGFATQTSPMVIDARSLGAADSVHFDASGIASAAGTFNSLSGYGGAGDDTFIFSVTAGIAVAKSVDISQGGNDTTVGTIQTVYAGSTFDAGDSISARNLILDGDYAHQMTLTDANLKDVQTFTLMAGHDYSLRAESAFSHKIDATALGVLDTLHLTARGTAGTWNVTGGAGDDVISAAKKVLLGANGGAGDDMLSGGGRNDTLVGGEGNDVLKGGGRNDTLSDAGGTHNVLDGGDGNDTLSTGVGADTLTGGTGLDKFVFTTASLAANMDTITDFSGGEKIDTIFHVTAFDAAVSHDLSAATFVSDLTVIGANLAANHAVVFTATGGDLAGHRYLLIGADATVGYNAGTDWVIQIDGTAAISTSTFI